jgi:hypothetical protein
LSEQYLRKAIDEGHTPNLKRWIEQGSHQVVGWETDFSSQTGAMQTGILLGNNTDVPAYRWWDREKKRMIMSGMPRSAAIETLSKRNGYVPMVAPRDNMFSNARPSMLTFSTIGNRSAEDPASVPTSSFM